MRYTTMRCTSMRYAPMRCTCKVHVYVGRVPCICKMHVYEVYAAVGVHLGGIYLGDVRL